MTSDDSPRFDAAPHLVREEAGALMITIVPDGHAGDVVVLSGWEGERVLRGRPAHHHLAPWLVTATVLGIPGERTYPLRFTP